jgi:hypothetical protein
MQEADKGADMSKSKERSEKREKIPSYLKKQLAFFMESQYVQCERVSTKKKDTERLKAYREWMTKFGTDFLATRFQRGGELASQEIVEARKIAHEYIGQGNHDFFCTCMDGRNLPVVIFSKVPHVGGVLRTPAGRLEGFSTGREPGSIVIDRKSPVVKQIEKLLTQRPNETIYYGLDSHYGCAARGLLYEQFGGTCQDKGLSSDIQEKLAVGRGLLALREQLIKEGLQVARIVPAFFSYNSATGYVTMGLEANIDNPDVEDVGFTFHDAHGESHDHQTFATDSLAKEEKIVRAEDLIHDAVIQSALMAAKEFIVPGSADFREDYAKALLNNWKAIRMIYGKGESKAFLHIVNKLSNAYSNSGWVVSEEDDLNDKKISTTTIHQKAKFMLKNIITRYAIAGTSDKWPFDTHIEGLGVITDGGYGPFPANDEGVEFDAFSIFSKDLDSMAESTRLVINLIRSSRKKKSVRNPYPEMLENGNDAQFENGPVMIVNKAILRIDDEKTWQILEKVDFSRLAEMDFKWAQMSKVTPEMSREVLSQFIPDDVMRVSDWKQFEVVFHELLQRMAILTQDNLYTSMQHGKLVVMNLVVDRNRKPRLILPLVV